MNRILATTNWKVAITTNAAMLDNNKQPHKTMTKVHCENDIEGGNNYVRL